MTPARRRIAGAIFALLIICIVFAVWEWQSGRLPWHVPAVGEKLILSSPASARPTAPGAPHGLFLLHDSTFGPPNAADWRRSYAGWETMGGWVEVTWEEINPAEGKYDFSRIIEYLTAA
ncbi:MAG: hypothetical protein ACUVWB_07765, partial [Anaerolineae bacterium]